MPTLTRELANKLPGAGSTHDLVVMGAVDQPNDGVAVMGSTVEVVIAQHHTPYLLLITHSSDSVSTASR